MLLFVFIGTFVLHIKTVLCDYCKLIKPVIKYYPKITHSTSRTVQKQVQELTLEECNGGLLTVMYI